MNLYTWISPHACCGEDKFIVPTILISISVMWGDRNAVWVRRRKAHRRESDKFIWSVQWRYWGTVSVHSIWCIVDMFCFYFLCYWLTITLELIYKSFCIISDHLCCGYCNDLGSLSSPCGNHKRTQHPVRATRAKA